MAKRPSLRRNLKDAGEAAEAVAQAKALADKQKPKQAAKANRLKTGETITTAIHINRDNFNLLKRAAVERSIDNGGRPSVSALIDELVDNHRAEIEAMAKAKY